MSLSHPIQPYTIACRACNAVNDDLVTYTRAGVTLVTCLVCHYVTCTRTPWTPWRERMPRDFDHAILKQPAFSAQQSEQSFTHPVEPPYACPNCAECEEYAKDADERIRALEELVDRQSGTIQRYKDLLDVLRGDMDRWGDKVRWFR